MSGLLLMLLTLNTSACEQQNLWLENKIAELEHAPVSNPPAMIIQKEWDSQTFYYIPAKCCDQYSSLYDQTGQLVCSPDGGFAGIGDGKCPAFVKRMTEGSVLWKDPR